MHPNDDVLKAYELVDSAVSTSQEVGSLCIDSEPKSGAFL